MSDIVIYSQGLVCTSVCAPLDMDIEDVERQVNAETPTGTQSQWERAHEGFANGAANPCPCEDRADRQHWLLTC